jgi:hypothetical protein
MAQKITTCKDDPSACGRILDELPAIMHDTLPRQCIM